MRKRHTSYHISNESVTVPLVTIAKCLCLIPSPLQDLLSVRRTVASAHPTVPDQTTNRDDIQRLRHRPFDHASSDQRTGAPGAGSGGGGALSGRRWGDGHHS